jgi:hypothetical protein
MKTFRSKRGAVIAPEKEFGRVPVIETAPSSK